MRKSARNAQRTRGYDVTIESIASTEPEVLTRFPTALLITSTYGDGDPPDGTEAFYEAVVHSKRVLLTRLRYSVLALGDSCYDQFCKCGKDYDVALERLGGTRIHPLGVCDTDYDDGADIWVAGVFAALEEERALLAA